MVPTQALSSLSVNMAPNMCSKSQWYILPPCRGGFGILFLRAVRCVPARWGAPHNLLGRPRSCEPAGDMARTRCKLSRITSGSRHWENSKIPGAVFSCPTRIRCFIPGKMAYHILLTKPLRSCWPPLILEDDLVWCLARNQKWHPDKCVNVMSWDNILCNISICTAIYTDKPYKILSVQMGSSPSWRIICSSDKAIVSTVAIRQLPATCCSTGLFQDFHWLRASLNKWFFTWESHKIVIWSMVDIGLNSRIINGRLIMRAIYSKQSLIISVRCSFESMGDSEFSLHHHDRYQATPQA